MVAGTPLEVMYCEICYVYSCIKSFNARPFEALQS
jgi:hypothetical protein